MKQNIRRWGAMTVVAGASVLVVGCVSQAKFEEARSAAVVEGEAHRQTLGHLHLMAQRLEQLQAELREREAVIAQREEDLAAGDLEMVVVEKEREQQALMVSQLSEELGRTGAHLELYSRENAELERELAALQAEGEKHHGPFQRLSHVANLVRDLTLLEAPALEEGDAVLLIDNAEPTLQLKAATLLDSPAALNARAELLMVTLGELARRYPAVRFLLSAPASQNDLVAKLSKAMVVSGVAEARIEQGELSAPGEGESAMAGDLVSISITFEPAQSEAVGVDVADESGLAEDADAALN